MQLRTTINAKPVKPRAKLRRSGQAMEKKRVIKMALSVCVPVLILFAIGVACAAVNERTEELSRKAAALEAKLHQNERAIADLELREERMKGRFIFAQAKKFHLNLLPPTRQQVRYLDRTPTWNVVACARATEHGGTIRLAP